MRKFLLKSSVVTVSVNNADTADYSPLILALKADRKELIKLDEKVEHIRVGFAMLIISTFFLLIIFVAKESGYLDKMFKD